MQSDPKVKSKDNRTPATIKAGNIDTFFKKTSPAKNARLNADQRNINLIALQNIDLEATKVHAKQDMNLASGGDEDLRSTLERQGDGNNYKDAINRNELKAIEGKINSTKGEDLHPYSRPHRIKKRNQF